MSGISGGGELYGVEEGGFWEEWEDCAEDVSRPRGTENGRGMRGSIRGLRKL